MGRSRGDTLGPVKETVERELKLEPGEGFVLPELGGELLPPRVFVSTYHDTPDLVLHAARRGSSSSIPARRRGRPPSCSGCSLRTFAAARWCRSRG